MSTYIQVNIGRNVGDVPMSDLRWLDFQNEVMHALLDLIADVENEPNFRTSRIEIHDGVGSWGGDREEESLHLSILLSPITPAPMTNRAMVSFKHRLQEIAAEYGQEAIALITGSRLLKAK